MELKSQMKMARFQTFWIQMRKNKPLDGSYKTDQTSGMKRAFYSFKTYKHIRLIPGQLHYLRTLDSSVSKSIRKRIPTETRV
ncbi:hypothetical protein Hanom_Chr14g01263201 [Helianthus anomalus]